MKRKLLLTVLTVFTIVVFILQLNFALNYKEQNFFPHEKILETTTVPYEELPIYHRQPAIDNNLVRIIIQECCRTDLIELQFNLFKKFLVEPFELILVLSRDASKNPSIGGTLADRSRELEGLSISHCPKNELDDCYDFSFKTLVKDFEGYVIIANSDMFLWRHFSIKDYMKRTICPIASLFEVHGDLSHFHPGFQILFPPEIPDLGSISWKKSGSDVGGATRFWIERHPEICVHPLLWSRGSDLKTLSNLKLIPLELLDLLQSEGGKLNSDLYLEGFEILHPRGGSNWQGEDNAIFQERFRRHFEFLRSRLEGTPLKWSNAGSAAIVHRNSLDVEKLPSADVVSNKLWRNEEHTWLSLLFDESDEIKRTIQTKKILLQGSNILKLPEDSSSDRTNIDIPPPSTYEQKFYKESTVFYWKYIYNGTTEKDSLPAFSTDCQKKSGQKYWVATWGSGEKRERLAKERTVPSCRSKTGIDEVVFWTDSDLDVEYKKRNAHLLNQTHGNGLWIWKHYVIYMMLERMKEGDILFYLDSDMACSDDTVKFFCLANKHDVTPFHHNHPWYTLSRLARRDAMIFMNLDFSKVAKSVQYSGGNIFVKKTPYSVRFVREMAAWSQQEEVITGWGLPSKYGVDWPEYLESNMKHQCDQAISSLMHVKYGHKSYPWRVEGFGAGSNDPAGKAERKEAGVPLEAKLIIDLN